MIKKHLPTVTNYLAKRKKASLNKLPKHLRPVSVWPLAIQSFISTVIMIALISLMLNKDDYLSDAGPAITLIVCLLGIIFCLVEGIKLADRYQKIRGERLARFNLGYSIFVFLIWAATVAVFLV